MAPVTPRFAVQSGGGPATEPAVRRAWSDRRGDARVALPAIDGNLLSQVAPWLGLLLGAFLVTDAYSWANSHSSGTHQFTLFWAGMFVFVLPTAYRLGRGGLQRNEQLLLLVVTALFFFLPKVLRNPSGPIYADELAHWRQAELLHQSGLLFKANPFISVAGGYPGLHALTDVLASFSGLSIWDIGVLIVGSCLVLNVVGIYMLAELLFETPRASGFAALIYACSSGFMFFDSQYAYESLGLPLLIWVLVALAQVLHREASLREQVGWLAVAAVLSLALIVTHHLTSIVLCIVLGVTSVIAIVQRRREPWGEHRLFRETLVFTACTIVATVLWALFAVPKLVHYLSPPLTAGIRQLSDIAQQEEGSRQLFALSTSPSYEHRSAFVSPVLAAGLVLIALISLFVFRRVRLSPLLLGIVVLGLAYFPSVPFILTTSGAEGARRSWDFSYIGVALLAGLAFDGLRNPANRWRLPMWAITRVMPLVLPVVVAAILLGNISSGLNVEYRFPGPYVFGSDTRSLTQESRGAVSWFHQTQGQSQKIIADRQDGIAFGSLGLNWIERAYNGLPLWNFYFQLKRPAHGVFRNIENHHDKYLIIDNRISKYLPRTGVYMVGDEPGAHEHKTPPPAAALTKYNVTPWTNRIYSSDNLQILRFDYRAIGLCTDQAPEPGVSFATCLGHR